MNIEAACATRILSMSMQQGLVGLGAWLTFQTGYFIIAHQLDVKDIATYAPLMQVTLGVVAIANLLQYSSTPFISRLYIRGELKRVVEFVLKFNQFVLLVTISSVVFLYINAPLLFYYWLGPSFHYLSSAFAILLIMVVLEVNHVSVVCNAIACGYLKFMKIAWCGALASFVFALILQKYLGVTGIALGLCLGQLTTNNWYATYLSLRFFSISGRQYFMKILVVLIYALGIVLLSLLLTHFTKQNGTRLFLSCLIFGSYFIIASYLQFKKDLRLGWDALRL